MANNPWDREIINPLEKPLSSDINIAQAQLDRSVRDYFARLFSVRASDASDVGAPPASGFVADGFKLRPSNPASMVLKVSNGIGFFDAPADVPSSIGGIVGLDDLARFKPLTLTVDESITVPASDPANPRIDILEVKYDRRAENSSTRQVLNGSGVFVAGSVLKTLASNQNGRSTVNGSGSINYKTGTPAGAPVAPATDAGYVKIAEVRVNATVTTLDYDMIKDLRRMLFHGNAFRVAAQVAMHSAGGSVVPAVTQLMAPPGVQLVFTGSSVTGAVCNVYLLAAGLDTVNSRVVPQVHVSNGFAAGNFVAPNFSGALALLNAGQATDIATNGIPAGIKAAENQPAWVGLLKATNQAAGVTGVAGLPDPVNYQMELLVSY